MKRILLFLFLLLFNNTFSQNKNQSIGFKENKGQIIDQKGKPNNAVKYLLNTGGLNVQLRKNGFSYDVYEVKKTPIVRPLPQTSKTLPYQIPERDHEKPEYNLEYIFHRIDIDFVNSNSKVELITDKASADFDNYYNIPNKPEGIVGVHQYKQITYKNIYSNIDVVFTIPEDPKKTVEYNFVIHPKGKISDIKLKFNGAETDLIDNKIQMNVRFGKMEETLPASWIEDGTAKKEIEVGYRKIKNNVYGFEATNHDSDKTLIIDPVPTRLWGTYYGGNSGDLTQKIKSDKLGNVIISGETSSSTNIATTGSFQNTKISIWDASYLSKLTPEGIRVWGTYINSAKVHDIAINSNNEIYVGGSDYGYNSGDNLTTPGAYKNVNPDFSLDGLVLKFNNDGYRIWGTLFGGIEGDYINTLSLDNQENLIIAGETHSEDGIATSNAFQPNNNDPFHGCGFFAKFSPSGNRISGSYFPGIFRYSSVDKDNSLIFAGQYRIDSDQTNIATSGAHQTQIYDMDGFIVKFNSLGHRLWCTYYGGDASFFISVPDYYDRITGIGTDALNNIYITGTTNSLNNISTFGAHKENQKKDGVDAFLAKFNSEGIRQWGTYYGSENAQGNDNCESSFISTDGNIYITGNTRSETDISTSDSFQQINNGSDEGFISKFDTTGKLVWGTYYGGSHQDYIKNIFYDDSFVYVIGTTTGSNNLGTLGTEYPSNGGGSIFIAKFQDCLSNPKVESNSPVCIGKTLELKASGGTTYLWTGPNGFTSTDQNPIITNVTTANSGEYNCLITGTGGCDDTKKITVVIGDNIAPIPDLTTLPTITGDCNTIITTIPTATDACAGAIVGTTTNPLSYALPGTYTIIWDYNDGNGNISHQNQTVTITGQPLPTADPLQTFCVQQNATVNDIQITGQNIKWYSNLNGGTLVPTTTVAQDKTTYYASQTINGCESERTPVTINIQVTFPPTGNANQSFCTAQNPTIADIQVTGTSIKWYDAVNNGNLLAETTNLVNAQTYYASQTVNNCEGQRFGITVSITNTPSAPSGNANQSFCKNENATLGDIKITGQNIKWYDTNFSATSLPSTTLLEDNRTYYASQTIGCEGDRTPILVRIYDTPMPVGNINQTFCIDENATINDLNISGTALTWYDAATNGNILPITSLLQNGNYYVTQTLNNCESQRFAIAVTIQDTQMPIADSPQKFCVQQNASLEKIKIEGQNIKWYDAVTGGINLSESTSLENGVTYYVSQTINDCESKRTPITVQILTATTPDCINYVDELPFPKFFTPNNDGHNDTWTIDFAYLAPNSSIRIFDRYGKFIKELPKNTDWDGTYIGHDEPASDYWFVVTRLNGAQFRGHFSLKR
ncbi:MAG: T9SS type B sorting domain-containing protein [Flavobacterium sp.]|nr:MAG: T9SS type B sorting domain-containing protein [Flavobacterium sp.]